MQIQFNRKQIVSTLLIGTMTLGIGSLTIQPVRAQLRSSFRETARELNLSRSQMREIAGIMQDFSYEIQEILTPEQFELLQLARKQQTPTQDPQDLQEALNLTETQSAQLAIAREEMVVELQDVLNPDQVDKIMDMTAFNQL